MNRRLTEHDIRRAVEETHGILEHAARLLEIPRSTLQGWFTTAAFEELSAYASQLRAAYAPPHQGRPFANGDNRTREVVARAWEESGYVLSACAKALGLPRSSVRHLVHRYRLPKLPARGR
ncbi:MAG: hypothetical protein JWN44_302 [Myxococcales bacterium]|nr:hypothetical protein [Myxococcales bacterium]